MPPARQQQKRLLPAKARKVALLCCHHLDRWPLNFLERTLTELMRPGLPHPSDEIPPKEVLRSVKAELDSLFASATVKTDETVTRLHVPAA